MEVIALEIEIGGLKRVVRNVGELEQAIRETRNELKSSGDIGSKEYKRVQRQLGSLKEVQRQVSAETRNQGREFIKSADQGKRSYRAMNAELVNLRMEFKELTEAERKGKIGQDIVKNIQRLDTELKSIDASIGQFQRNVGNYRQALIGIGDVVTGGLITGGIQQLLQGFKQQVTESIQVTADFSRQIGLLGAITGSTGEQLNELRQLALEYGGSTEFTASEVASLEIEFAKLGFTAEEIKNVLPATIDAATISGEDLGRVANVVGSGVRAFGLDVTQTGELVDVMAASFSSSALDLSKFETAISTVGATSRVVGQPIEQTTAQLGILANNGIDASTAATSLRNIFIKLAASGTSLEDAFAAIRESTDPLTTAVELFDVRAANVAVTLAQQEDQVNSLTSSLNEVRFATTSYSEEAASAVRNDLQGAIDGAKSAFEAFRITVVGTVETGLKNFINGVANVTRAITSWISQLPTLEEFIGNVKRQMLEWTPVVVALGVAIVTTNSATIFAAITAIPQYIVSLGRALVSTRAFTIVQTALNAVLRANPIGLIITAVGLLTTALIKAYRQSATFRATFDGLGALAKEFFTIIKEAVSSFVDGFNQLREGDLRGSLRSFGQAIVKANPISAAITEGRRLGNAFSDAYERSLQESRAAEQAASYAEKMGQDMGEAIQEGLDSRPPTPPDLDDTLTGNAGNAGSVNLGDDPAGPYRELTQAQNELSAAIKDAIVAGEPYGDLLEEYMRVTDDLNTANEKYKMLIEEIVAAQALAEGSIKAINEEIKLLRSNLEEADPGSIGGIVNELVAAEQKLADAQLEIERATNIALGGTGVLEEDIAGDVEAIEARRQRNLIALEQQLLDEEAYNERKKQINLEADLDILSQRLQLYEEGSVERLEIERQLLEKQRELNLDFDGSNIEAFKQRADLVLGTLSDTFAAVGTIGDARTEREIANLERRYDRELELAAGNQEEIERIEEEKDRKLAAIQKEAFERQKRLQIASAYVSAAQGIVNIIAAPTTIPDPLGAIYKALRVGILLATTAAQVASINAQTYAQGGYTGRGTHRDETGHRVAGVVHEGEYVVPKRVLKTDEGARMVGELERMRKGMHVPSDGVYRHKRLFVTGGLAKVPEVQPLLPGAAGVNVSVSTQPTFSDDQVDRIVQGMMTAAREGTKQGTIEASEEVNLNNQRRNRLSNITG